MASGVDGRFDLGSVPDGSYDLEVLHPDYTRRYEASLAVRRDDSTVRVFEIEINT